MNHIYRVIFNTSLGVYQCVSEITKSRGKSTSSKSQSHSRLLLTPLSIAMLSLTGTAMAATYNDGQTHIINDDPYVVSDDVMISGKDTKVQAKNLTIVAKDSSGSLTINNDGAFDTFALNVGQNFGSDGRVLIDGKPKFYLDDTLIVGDAGKGLFTLKNDEDNNKPGGQDNLLVYKDAYIGNKSTGEGKVVVDGSGADLRFYQNLYVGNEGTGNFTVKNIGVVNIGDTLVVGSKAGSKNNLVEVSTPSRNGYHSFISAERVILGDAGAGDIKISTSGGVSSNSDFIIANQKDSSGNINLDNGSVSSKQNFVMANGDNTVANANLSANSRMRSDKNIIIANGINSTANVTADKDSSISAMFGDIIVGNKSGSVGEITLDASKLFSQNIILGQQGSGTLNINNDPNTVGNVDIFEDTYLGGFGENSQDAKGMLNINNASFRTRNLIIGNTGSGILKADGLDSYLSVEGIERNTASKQSDIYLNGTTIEIKADQPNLFANFNKDNTIQLGKLGVVFDTEKFQFGANVPEKYIATNVTINPNAIITGDVGKISFDNGGGFVKTGSGTLEFSMSSKKWTGDLGIADGTLKINGDYSMADNETLVIGLYDKNNNGIIESDEYGKLDVNGAVDIRKGDLFVYTEHIPNVSTNEIKNIVRATTRQGEFKTVTDNSPLVSFKADYSDANAVHLIMTRSTTPPVTPEPPVVVPPVTPPPVVVPPTNPEPPVVTPPVTPPPVVVPPVTPKPPVDYTFVKSVKKNTPNSDLGIAYVLDKSVSEKIDSGSNKLADALITSTIDFSEADLAAAANQLQPLLMGGVNRLITDTNYAVSDAIRDHSFTTTDQNLWAKIIGHDMTQDADNGITGYDSKAFGAIVGLDTPISNHLNVGAALSYIDSDTDSNGTSLNHEIKAKNWQLLGYGRYAINEATLMNFHAGAGSSDVKGERKLSMLTDATASSDYSVNTLQAGLGVGHRIGTALNNVTPFAQVNYAQAKSDAYRETGAGVYNLNVDENTYKSTRWTAGVNMAQALTPKLSLTGQLAAAIENGDRRSDITASFIDMPNDKFTTFGQDVGREIGIAGVGLSYAPTPMTNLSLAYRGEWRDNYNDQGASIGLKTLF